MLVRSGWRAELIVNDLQARGLPVSDWRADTYTPEDRRLLAACLSTVCGTLNARQVEVLSAVMRVEPKGTIETEKFLAVYSAKPLAAGLSNLRDLLFKGGSAYQIARAAQQAVAAQDADLGASLEEIVTCRAFRTV